MHKVTSFGQLGKIWPESLTERSPVQRHRTTSNKSSTGLYGQRETRKVSCHVMSHSAHIQPIKNWLIHVKLLPLFNHKASGACNAVLSRLAQEECPTSNLPLWLVDRLQARLTVHTIPVYGPLILNTHYSNLHQSIHELMFWSESWFLQCWPSFWKQSNVKSLAYTTASSCCWDIFRTKNALPKLESARETVATDWFSVLEYLF